LSPGVYVEEVSYRSNIIESLSTTTTGFVGPTGYGPTNLEPELLTSLADFEATYGDSTQSIRACHRRSPHAARETPPLWRIPIYSR
jgi:phage tail sheath protein FI